MREISLTQAQVTQVDNEDFKWLNQWKWYALWDSGTESFYARRKDLSVTPCIFIHMARFIMNCPDDMMVDHRNHLTLDNQKENLRTCTPSQNQQNQRRHVNSTSKHKGVTWHKPNQKWIARIHTKDIFDQSVHIHLGCFKIEEEAALAYDKAASKEFGEFACLNFPRRNNA